MHRALAALVLVVALALPGTAAFAAGAGEAALTAGPGALLGLEGETRAGAIVDVRFLYGLSDAWSARLGLGYGWLDGAGSGAATHVVSPSFGLTAAADVLDLVPFGELGIVLADHRGGGERARHDLGAQMGAGVDYFVSRRLTLTLLGRLSYFPVHLRGPSGPAPIGLDFALHVGHVFGP